MKVTAVTRERLRCRRIRRRLMAEGYEEVGELGGRTDCVIMDAVIAPEDKSIFVKVGKRICADSVPRDS